MPENILLAFVYMTLGGLVALIGLGLFWRITPKRPKIQNPADPLIPTREEMRNLYGEVLAGNDAAAELWLRGAIYYESQLPENGGFTPAQALEAALDPGIGHNVILKVV